MWSLSNQTVSHINLPKEANPGIDFSIGGSYMAIVERRVAQDCVAIYSCDTWAQVTVSFCHNAKLFSFLFMLIKHTV